MNNLIKQIFIKTKNNFTRMFSGKTQNVIVQFIRFGIIGLSNTIISYIINVIVLLCMIPCHVKWDYIVGNIIAFLLSVLWSFYWNNRLVFKAEKDQHRNVLTTIIKTYLAYGFTGIILNNFLSMIWISYLNISKYFAPLLNLIISVPINFFLNKLWAFKD